LMRREPDTTWSTPSMPTVTLASFFMPLMRHLVRARARSLSVDLLRTERRAPPGA
jgi:hypothetical protein